MRNSRTMKLTAMAVCLFLLTGVFAGAFAQSAEEEKIRPAVVIMAMFENGELTGDFPGEAQLYYEAYFTNPEVYDITLDPYGCRLYVENDVGLCLLGEGKSSAAINVTALLSDARFDFTDTVFLVSGCAGSSMGYGVAGDVYLITATVDYDLGHSADVRELAEESDPIWYRTEEYDPIAFHIFNPALAEYAYALVKDIPLQTTDDARACMARNFDSAEWAMREPMVLKGTSVTSDDYWKGEYKHERANYITETYGAPDPYAATIMEDSAIALAFKKMGMFDQLLIIRCSVNMDVFLDGATPESAWAEEPKPMENGFDGFMDIFPVSMENCFRVGKTIVDAILAGEWNPDLAID